MIPLIWQRTDRVDLVTTVNLTSLVIITYPARFVIPSINRPSSFVSCLHIRPLQLFAIKRSVILTALSIFRQRLDIAVP